MIVLKTDLTRDDLKFISNYIKFKKQQREMQSIASLTALFTQLAEQGQTESIQMYYENLAYDSAENTQIFQNMQRILQRPIKTPRDLMTISSYYKWHFDKLNSRLDTFQTTDHPYYQNYHTCRKQALELLDHSKSLDPLAMEYLLELPSNSGLPQSTFFNFRGYLYSSAQKQINEDKRNKLLFAYAKNVIKFAPDDEYRRKTHELDEIIATIQKTVSNQPQH